MGVLEIQAVGVKEERERERGSGGMRKSKKTSFFFQIIGLGNISLILLKGKLDSVFPLIKALQRLSLLTGQSLDSFKWLSAPLWPTSPASPANHTSLQQYQSALNVPTNTFSYYSSLFYPPCYPCPVPFSSLFPDESKAFCRAQPTGHFIQNLSLALPSLTRVWLRCSTSVYLIILFDLSVDMSVFLIKLWYP